MPQAYSVSARSPTSAMDDWEQKSCARKDMSDMPAYAGITEAQIIAQNLPLPHQNFLPETMEEKVICYADKFFSKTHLDREKTIEKAEKSLMKFGEEGVKRFQQWERMFE